MNPSTEQSVPSGRHPVNIGHLVMGLAFVGLVGVWALVQGDVVHGDDIRWLLPLPWVLAGIAGLLATTLSSRNRWSTRQTGWVAPTTEPSVGHPDAPTDTTPAATPAATPPTTDRDTDPDTDPDTPSGTSPTEEIR